MKHVALVLLVSCPSIVNDGFSITNPSIMNDFFVWLQWIIS